MSTPLVNTGQLTLYELLNYFILWRGCPPEVGYLMVRISWPSALHCNPSLPGLLSAESCPGTPRQNWSANIYINYGIN